MLEAAGVDVEKAAARSLVPSVIIRAVVPKPFGPQGDDGVGKDKAKACGFQWENAGGKKFPFCWVKQVKESEVAQEKEKLGYEIRIVEN